MPIRMLLSAYMIQQKKMCADALRRENTVKEKRRRTLSREITALTVATSVGTLFLLGLVLIGVFLFLFLENAGEDMEYVLNSTNEKLKSRVEFIEDGAIAIRHNPVLKGFLKNEEYEKEAASSQLGYAMELFSPGNMAEQIPFVESVYLFNSDQEQICRHYYPLTAAAAREEEELCRGFLEQFLKNGRQYESYIEENNWYLCFWMYDEDMEKTGVCMAQIQRAAVEGIFSAVEGYQDWGWSVRDHDRILMEKGSRMDEEKLVYSSIDSGFGIQAASAVGKKNLYTVLQPTMIVFLLILLLALLLAAALALACSYRLTKPLKKVRESMRAFGEKELDVRMDDFEIQEFHDISAVFNEMADRIQHLITQVYEKELLATRLQVKYLQAQITPHFQFNILSMLSIKAKMAGNEELYQSLRAFSELVRGKIFRRKEIKIPVAEELELVEFYLYLQNSRFRDKITYEIKYHGEELKKDLIPRLLIEPLVENAVSHGLEPKEGNGRVCVELYEEGENLHILVEDDGVGFEEDPEEMEPEKEGHTHTGLENTRKLLYILYGDRHRWKVSGKKGEGTKVEIVIPVERGEEDVESNGSR